MNIKELREAAGLSQAELARKLGYTRQAVSLWELGTVWPSAQALPALARALGCSIDELFEAGETPEDPPAALRDDGRPDEGIGPCAEAERSETDTEDTFSSRGRQEDEGSPGGASPSPAN